MLFSLGVNLRQPGERSISIEATSFHCSDCPVYCNLVDSDVSLFVDREAGDQEMTGSLEDRMSVDRNSAVQLAFCQGASRIRFNISLYFFF